MKYLIIIISLLFSSSAFAQANDEELKALLENQTIYETLKCKVDVCVNVPGVDIPDKEIFIQLRKGKAPKIEAKGLLILPKKGLIGQFNDLINSKYQAIQLYNQADTLMYKLVSLDKKSDWITADIYFTRKELRIYKMEISTRKHGDFEIYHSYQADGAPKHTRIVFEISESKIPLKFLGRSHKTKSDEGPQEGIGEIDLKYSDVVF